MLSSVGGPPVETIMDVQTRDAFEKAQKDEKEGRIKEALASYSRIVEQEPEYRPALVALGALYSRSGKPARAIPLFKKALELKVTDSILFNLGSESFKLNLLDESRIYLTRALKLNSGLLRAHILLAYTYGKKKEFEKASVYFKNALKLDSKNRPARLGLVVSLSEAGNYEAALKAMNLLGEEEVASDQVLRNLKASLLMQTGQLKESLNSYKSLTDQSPEFTSFTDHLKAARSMMEGEFEGVFTGIDDKIKDRSVRVKKLLQDKQAGVDVTPNQEDLKDMVDLSLLHLFNGDKDRALRFLFQAKKLKDESESK